MNQAKRTGLQVPPSKELVHATALPLPLPLPLPRNPNVKVCSQAKHHKCSRLEEEWKQRRSDPAAHAREGPWGPVRPADPGSGGGSDIIHSQRSTFVGSKLEGDIGFNFNFIHVNMLQGNQLRIRGVLLCVEGQGGRAVPPGSQDLLWEALLPCSKTSALYYFLGP